MTRRYEQRHWAWGLFLLAVMACGIVLLCTAVTWG